MNLIFILFTRQESPPEADKPMISHFLSEMVLVYLTSLETFEKCSILVKFKEGDNSNHRNTLSISRIKI